MRVPNNNSGQKYEHYYIAKETVGTTDFFHKRQVRASITQESTDLVS